MMKEAIREGQEAGQKELANKKEHPIAVLQRIKNFQIKLDEENEKLDSIKEDLKLAKEKFNSYTDEERELAENELRNAIENNIELKNQEEQSLTIEEIRNEIMQDVNTTSQIEETLYELKTL